MAEIPESHPRRDSLLARQKLVDAAAKGLLAESAMIAQGRGEAYDYLLGEQTSESALLAIREVAARLLAETGSRAYGSLSVLHRLCVDVELATQLGGERFYPAARIRSSFLRMTPRSSREADGRELREVERLVRSAFGQRREMLGNSLAEVAQQSPGAFEAAGVSLRDRPQSVPPERWLALARALSGTPGPPPDC